MPGLGRAITSLVWPGARWNSSPRSANGWKGWMISGGRRRCSTWTCRKSVLLGEPYTRQLGEAAGAAVYCGGERVRISYWIAPGRRIIMLTVFTKTRMRETAEIARAAAAMARCQRDGHTADE